MKQVLQNSGKLAVYDNSASSFGLIDKLVSPVALARLFASTPRYNSGETFVLVGGGEFLTLSIIFVLK